MDTDRAGYSQEDAHFKKADEEALRKMRGKAAEKVVDDGLKLVESARSKLTPEEIDAIRKFGI